VGLTLFDPRRIRVPRRVRGRRCDLACDQPFHATLRGTKVGPEEMLTALQKRIGALSRLAYQCTVAWLQSWRRLSDNSMRPFTACVSH